MNEKVLKHVRQRSKKWGIPLPSNTKDSLANIEDSFQEKGIYLRFAKGRGLNSSKLGANAGLFRSSFIMLTPEWAAYLVLKNSDVVQNAFLSTVGHEMTHKEGKDINPFRHLLNVRFIASITPPDLPPGKFRRGLRSAAGLIDQPQLPAHALAATLSQNPSSGRCFLSNTFP